MSNLDRNILLIEDDRIIQRFLTLALETNGYKVKQAFEGAIGLAMLVNQQIDLVLLDLGLPDLDGMDVLHEIRQISNVPVIIISARGRESDKVNALDSGANDYVTKPFNINEVLARIRVALRSSNPTVDQVFTFQDLNIDFERRQVKISETDIHLTPIEFKLLELLVKNQGKVLTHNFIQDHIWGYQSVDDYQSLRVFMASLRKKLSINNGVSSFIITEIGVGYRFRDE
jgi:two-component system KDP operon response regulator KdpE